MLPAWLLGVEGDWNQVQLIRAAFSLAQREPGFQGFAVGLLHWAWQERPLDKGFLELLLTAERGLGLLTPPARALLAVCNRQLRIPASDPQWPAVAGASNQDLTDFLRLRVADPEHGLFWLGEGFSLLLDRGLFAEARELIDAFPAKALRPILDRLLAEWAFYALTPGEAMDLARRVDSQLFGPWRDVTLATLHARQGDAQRAVALLHPVRRAMPWHINLTLTLHDLVEPPFPPLPAAGRPAVCCLLYSWNKAGDLDRTLDSLRDSDCADARVFALDNGSDDETLAVLRRHAASWPHGGGFEVIGLPVNIGAPAARNWLLAQPGVRACDWVAFLDDDIVLPRDWLDRLLGAAAVSPQCGAIGCRIVGHLPPHRIQATDFHLLPPAMCKSGFVDYAENIFIGNNCIGLRDAGLFTYSRPCASVTGCCHLLNTRAIEAAGPFDIRFAPSQFDDLERDLRSYLAGFPTLYVGQLSVGHVQYSSLSQAATPAKQAHIFGNKLKLEHLYTREQIQRIAQQDLNVLLEDVVRKSARLDAALPRD